LSSSPASLERRLVVAIGGVLSVALAVFALALYLGFGRALTNEFDSRLVDDAQGVADMVEEHAEGPWEVEGSLEEFERNHGLLFFEAWMDDGTALIRSPALGGRDLPREYGKDGPVDVVLPNGHPGRAYRGLLVTRRDEDETGPRSGRRLTVTVARGNRGLSAAKAALESLLAGTVLLVLVLSAIAVRIILRRGFAPAGRLAHRLGSIDAAHLGERIAEDELPSELRAPVSKLNELLARLEASFEKERRFSSDVSHELRTPVAGIRSILEVAVSRERSTAEYRASMLEAIAVVETLSRLVDNLLTLARMEAQAGNAVRAEVVLADLVNEVAASVRDRLRVREITLENRVPASAVVVSDPERLRIVLSNLVENAVEYTEVRGSIVIASDPARDLVVEVRDSGPPIPDADLARIFERFARLDPSRQGSGAHVGIGLAIVKSLCDALDFTVSARNVGDGGVAFRVERSARS
jgi:two-component system sensor histidine kinase QseC